MHRERSRASRFPYIAWWFSAVRRSVFQCETDALVSSELNVLAPSVVLLRQVRMNVALGKDNVR